ncbi:FAD-dependent oxidoreductase [Candidatus Sumerlaeota bacterium]|nr:FAD-dependent oxidoreductase [Candidatus Sumerlaeota bacterium]
MNERIVIIGGGPTGLGCAYRLAELGCESFQLYEANDYVGGLAASFVDRNGFTWDVGGHVLFSHYAYFDELLARLLGGRFLNHNRASWIRIGDRFVPYPFQNNLRYLPKEVMSECLSGLQRVAANRNGTSKNFLEWILEMFGDGIAKYFMQPYNEKVWAYPLEKMSENWIAERVSVVDYQRALQNVLQQRDDVSWGPNSAFKFPLEGGTGAIYRAFLPYLGAHVSLRKRCARINTEKRTVLFENGEETGYDRLVSTAPLTELVSMLEPAKPDLVLAAKSLVRTSGIMVGLGFSRPCPSDKCWMYFPETRAPFYRLTYFSNYSPKNVPDDNSFSLMAEISYSPYRELEKSNVINDTIEGLVQTGVIQREWAADISSTHVIDVPFSYPVPTMERDRALSAIVPALDKEGIYTRGRFGLWIYEIGNMDHSVMQGVELADFLLNDAPQSVIKPYSFLFGGKNAID